MAAFGVVASGAGGVPPLGATAPASLRTALLFGACSWLLATPMLPAAAATAMVAPAAAVPAAASGGGSERRLPLIREDAVLQGGQAAYNLPLYLPGGRRSGPARLTLTYANALAVEPEKSTLVVSANGEPLVELPLVAAQGAVTVEIGLPAGTLRPGANLLTFVARQRHRFACSREEFNELWVRLDRDRSFLDLVGAEGVRPTLAGLDALLASSLYDGEPFTVLTVRPPADEVVPHWGGLAAEGYALRRSERPARIDHAVLRTPGIDAPGEEWTKLAGRNVALVGTHRDLEGVLPLDLLPRSAGSEGAMAVLPLPGDPDHVAVVLTGPNEAAVTQAAEAFRTAVTPPVNAAAANAGGHRPALMARPTATTPRIVGGRWLSLAELGYTTTGQVLSSVEEIELPVHLPETFYGGDGQKLRLELNFAYGAGLAPTSALIVSINGAPWNMVRLDRRGGAIVDSKEIELPLGQLRPGPNTIGLRAILDPTGPETCAAVADRPMFSLFDDSRIHVPGFARLARQPDLSLFGATGYPYSSAPADEVELIVTEASSATLGAAWTLRGKLAQQRGGSLPGFRSGYRSGAPDRHLLVVGPRDTLPPALRNASPLTAAARADGGAAAAVTALATGANDVGVGRGGSPAADWARRDWAERLETSSGSADGGSPFETAAAWFVGMARAVPSPRDADDAVYRGSGALSTRERPGAIVAFRSPFVDNRTVTVVTAASPEALQRAVSNLVTPVVWRQLDGDAMGWGDPSAAVVSVRTAEPYLIQPVDTSPGHLMLLGQTFLARHTIYWLALVFGVIGAASLTTRALLRRMTA